MVRTDEKWFANLLRTNNILKFVVLILLAVIGILAYMNIELWKAGQKIYVFDSKTGRSYSTSKVLTRDHVDIMVLHRTNAFLRDFYTKDFAYIEKAKKKAAGVMVGSLRKKLSAKLFDKRVTAMSINKKASTKFEYLQEPSIIRRAHPVYTVFAKLRTRTVYNDRTYEDGYGNIRLHFRMRKPSLEKPDGLWLEKFEIISDEDTQTLNEIYNLIK